MLAVVISRQLADSLLWQKFYCQRYYAHGTDVMFVALLSSTLF